MSHEPTERGTRFRVEVACDGYANLTEADIPEGVVSDADYAQGARDAAEGIRSVLTAEAERSNRLSLDISDRWYPR